MGTIAEQQLAKLVSMRTISENLAANEQAIDYIQDYLMQRGLHCVRNFAGSKATLIASTQPNNGLTPTVALSAHVDVVPASDELFALKTKGDKLLGRGTYDMKFAIASYMQLVDELKDNLENYDFSIVITGDEEPGDHYGMQPLVTGGLRPGICIMPDSTAPGWDIETVTKGFWRFMLISNGRSGHAARPWEGENAVFKLIDALHELKNHFADHAIDTDTLNIAILDGGEAFNKIPHEATAKVEIRYLSKENLAQNQKMIAMLCAKHGLVQETNVIAPPVVTDLSHPLVQPYLESVAAVTGREPEPFIGCAATSAPWLFAVGVTCISSCCLGGDHHKESEWISRKSFLQFVPILRDYLDRTARRSPNIPAV